MDRLMLIDELFKVDPFSRVNIVMIQKLGLATAIVSDELEQRQEYWDNLGVKEWYATYDDIMKKTGLTRKQISYGVKKLVECGLVYSAAPVYKNEMKVKYYRFDFNAKDDLMKSKVDGSVSRNYTPDKFILYSKTLAIKIGPECTLIMRDLCRTYIEAAKRDNLIDRSWFECKRSSLAEKMGMTGKTVGKYLDQLVEHRLIERKRANNSIHVKINFSVLLDLFGFNDWEEVSALIDERIREKEKKRMTAAESIAKRLLAKIKRVSGNNWSMSYRKVADIEDLIASGYAERDLENIVTYVAGKNDEDLFNWESLFSVQQANYWHDCICREAHREREDAKVRAIVQRICKAMREHSDGKVDWIVDDEKIKLISKCINCDEHFSEEELIQFAIDRYDSNSKNNYTMTLFEKLYTETDNIIKNRNLHKVRKNAQQSKKSSGSKDGVKSNSYTQEQKEKFKQRAAEIEAEGGQGVF